jgi:hypothetical protein
MSLQSLRYCGEYPKLTLLLSYNLVEHEKFEEFVKLGGVALLEVFTVKLGLLNLRMMYALRVG